MEVCWLGVFDEENACLILEIDTLFSAEEPRVKQTLTKTDGHYEKKMTK